MDIHSIGIIGVFLWRAYSRKEKFMSDKVQSEHFSYRDKIIEYVKKKYKTKPEYLWKSTPDAAVFRHSDNNKWYGLIMNVWADRLGLSRDEQVDILNVKINDAFLMDMLLQQKGYSRGYHMNKMSWLTILLDGTVSFDDICDRIDESFLNTASAKKKNKVRPPKEWIIPANPKYYDIVHAFDNTDIIDWKQGSGIKVKDTIYMYVGAPVSAILYKCKVIETDIPYDYEDGKLTISALMKIKLLKRYDADRFTFNRLKEEFGIYAVRGPRGIPNSLSAELSK